MISIYINQHKCAQPHGGNLQRLKILVVDDESEWRKTLQYLLGHDHEVTLSTDVRPAMALIDKYMDFDLVISDFTLIDMTNNGVDLLLHAQKLMPRAKLRLMSHHIHPSLEETLEDIEIGIYLKRHLKTHLEQDGFLKPSPPAPMNASGPTRQRRRRK